MRLAGQVAIVTGAGSGIGRASALRFAREGACVTVVDLDASAADAVAAEIVGEGGAAFGVAGDASREDDVATMVERTVQAYGSPTVLVNSAATTSFGTLAESAVQELDRVMRVNVGSAWICARAVIPLMRAAGGGAIVNLSSITGIVGAPGMAAYSTSKGAIITLTRTLALELAEEGIRVNCICPASIDTPMLQASFDRQADPQAARARNVKRHPLGRLGTAEDVANLALFLASDEAAFITGGTYVVDGGALLARRWQE
ncbi:4-formylbenzenesulfonate dehydrogenase TsaC1/TsaC2 [Luteitalea pratensis]|uniref:4-formylbenzenesulfonate dehydrogenase TsaC1/TsaC2 n=1 Tax=Luteitalea pratensis TaxID=1855912 RepID=A0A143PNS5_LUTPR|nr:SDR family oxidoreductase [Luteitalea pratensis]AMY09429.1 4-formylbenzenesulfonate dehydrogenase TsaC1/TsaC2 [Luteitalea pratensis]